MPMFFTNLERTLGEKVVSDRAQTAKVKDWAKLAPKLLDSYCYSGLYNVYTSFICVGLKTIARYN